MHGAGESMGPPLMGAEGNFTSAHSSIFSEGVSRWAGALVGAKGVDAAEGTEQGIQCTFIDIWEAGERIELDCVLSAESAGQ